MATVHTEYGPGQIIERETVRGRTRYKVAGEGFEVWLDQTKLGGLDDYDRYNDSADDRDGYEEDIHDLRHRLRADEEPDDGDPGRYSRRTAWAPLDRGNSTDLPYNPDPQYDAIGSPGDDGSSTIQPIHNIDPDERLTPADSITFEEGEEDDEPAPDGDLFAREGSLHEGVVVPPWWVIQKGVDEIGNRYPRVREVIEKTEKGVEDVLGLPEGSGRQLGNDAAMGGAVGGAAALVDHEATEAVNWAGPGGSQGGYGQMIRNSSVDREGYAQALLPVVRALAPMAVNSLMGGGDEGGEEGQSDYGPGEGYGDMIEASYRPAGLSDRYIDITADFDYHNDPVAQFRHDPVAYINRVGHLMDEGLNPRFAEYMDLVEADGTTRTAAWKDVRKKAMRLKREGHVTVQDIAPNRIMASVVGDHGTYDVVIFKSGAFSGLNNGYGGNSISNWHCGCEWGKWAFRRKYTYVGRLCSHAYASYLTMQSAHMTGKPRQQRDPNRTKGKGKKPVRSLPFLHVKRGGLHLADALQNGPERLTPDMVVNDTDDAHMFVDVEKDERTDTGPDDVVSDKDIVHFARLMRHCEVAEQPYPRRLVAFLSRYADCADGGDDTPGDHEAQDGSEAGPYLEKLRDLADSDQSDDFGSMADRVHAIQHTVEEAREHGVDASQFVAMLRTAAPGDGWETTQDGGRTVYRQPGTDKGYVNENGRFSPADFTGRGSQGPETGRYDIGDGPSYTQSTENGRDLYRTDWNNEPKGYAVDVNNRSDVRDVNYVGDGEFGGNQRFDIGGGEFSDENFQNFLKGNPGIGQATPAGPGGVKTPAPPAPPAGPGGVKGPTLPAGPGGALPAQPGQGGVGTGGAGGKGAGGQTSGTVSDGGKAGAENGNNNAITKADLDADGNYTVGAGDTWTDIAQRTTGDMNNYQKMYDLNKGVAGGNIDGLAEGTKVNLKDFATDVGNSGVRGDVTNPTGGGQDKNPATADAGPAVETSAATPSGSTVSTANGFAATTPQPKPAPATQPADASKQTSASRRRAQAPAQGDGQSSDQSGQPSSVSPGAEPATNPATGQPSSPGAAAPATPASAVTPVNGSEPAAPDKQGDTLDPNDPAQVAENAQARPGQQPATMPATMGTGMGMGMGGVGDALSTGVGVASDIASGLGGALPGIGSAVSGIASGLGSIFSSRQDAEEWRRYAYPTADGEGDLEPHTHPFAGSGWPGPLDIGTSEEYADEQRGGMDDVTDLEGHDVDSSMAKWQKQGGVDAAGYDDSWGRSFAPRRERSRDTRDRVQGRDPSPQGRADPYHEGEDDDGPYREANYDGHATDDSSDIVRSFQASMGGASFDTPGGGGRYDDFASAAQGFLRTAGRNYSLAEQSELIREGDKGGARNLDSLDLTGTHYEDMTTLGW